MRNALLLFTFLVATSATQAAAQCPTIVVKGPAGITNPGDDVTFRAEINVVGPKLSYSWSVDKGTIIEGQGTPEIKISTLELSGETVTATVEISGLPDNCEQRALESAGIAERPGCGMPFDMWGKLKPNDQRGRLDLLMAQLANNPESVAVLTLRVLPDEKLDPRNRRIQFVLKHFRFREFDKSRIWFALELAEEESTMLHLMLPGSEPPSCDGCLWFKGEQL